MPRSSGAAGPRLCPARAEALRARGQGPAGHRVPGQLLRALGRVRLHRRSSRTSSTTWPAASLDWKEVLRAVLGAVHGAVDEAASMRAARGPRRARRRARPLAVPGQRRRRRPARSARACGAGTLEPQARQVRPVHRLLELPGVPLHPPVRRPAAMRPWPSRCDRGCWASTRPSQEVVAEDRAFRPLHPARQRATRPSACRCRPGLAPDAVDLEMALRLLALPREVRQRPRDRRADPGRDRPLRPLRPARQAAT